MDPSKVESLFGGLARNRSIQALKIHFCPYSQKGGINPFMKQVFEALFPFFQFNDNFQVLDLNLRSGLVAGYYSSVDGVLSGATCKQITEVNSAQWRHLLGDAY
jgi:hypothetical protein